ncbi:DUF4145 domain-containing protein [Oceanobacillus profundus]|uniref:DUF4145 domain-containing protein n=1 Tax=Oceanobacillus TaxID=182709 RepID=UPI000BA71197|nr:DUF4145 domain-containing protein [Oceanobacillus profundus]MBR3121297.1 DUF4145 domain-containing protein [Oceanobacillus sp.]MCM3398354.1 DUF4145 domain-containing protein [Oceanobacillus profundus]MDO6451393.1 DUF4145 domain-containing protein [Oceanobacillus profundus]PAE30757.1 transposase [Paenibacillus sp. 7884-2]
MKMDNYYYHFLEQMNKELAFVARELEHSIFASPRTMLTHARVFVETILQLVMKEEELPSKISLTLIERIDTLNDNGYITIEVRDALHSVRMLGNQAAHDTRKFRYSEALQSWEAVYVIVRWYVETYGPIEFIFPEYQDPAAKGQEFYDISEIEIRLGALEQLLNASVGKHDKNLESDEKRKSVAEETSDPLPPGFTTIRKLVYKKMELEIPYFLRDAFLLPQRFERSEMFLIRLGAEQQARIMSELPNNLEGLSTHVKRYKAKNEEILFEELEVFIEEEKQRREIMLDRPGELFFFFKEEYLVVTEELAKLALNEDIFSGFPSLLKQLRKDQMVTVGQLPKELVILAKYDNVGIGTIKSLFEQMKQIQTTSTTAAVN